MSGVYSFSLGDSEEDKRRLRTLNLLKKREGGLTAAMKKLLDLYAASEATVGATPTEQAYTAERVRDDVNTRRKEAALLASEADQLEAGLEDLLQQQVVIESGAAKSYRSAEEMVADHWPNIRRIDVGEARRSLLNRLAAQHNLDERAVYRAAAKQVRLDKAGQTSLNATPRGNPS